MSDKKKIKVKYGPRLNILGFGSGLLIFFWVSVVICVAFFLNVLMYYGIEYTFTELWGIPVGIIVVENIIFWTGIIMVYLTSKQMKWKLKLIGILVGMIPVAHLIALFFIIKTSLFEYFLETTEIKTDAERKDQQICKTKYPILMIHGIFFRDFKRFNYWGRIPRELELNGATIYYGNHESAETVDKSAAKLAERVRQVVEETGCGKVNVIAHSKGGLDIKYAIATTDISKYIASVTTINTPHRGCEFAEYLLNKAPEKSKIAVAAAYNKSLKALGDKSPDFLAATGDLTATKCKEISEIADKFDYKAHGIYTQSVGSRMRYAINGAFPLNMSFYLVKYFDGPNDGLVGEPSFHWGEDYTFLTCKGRRGISHGDMIDLNREDIPGFDVREFYVKLVSNLKERGL